MTLDYFYGQSGELFAYFRIPKALFQDSRFRQLSTDARTLYGILLDRMSLSAKNGWLDEQGRVYIIYTVREVQESLCCAEHKAVKLFRELEQANLIERKRRGLGRPSLMEIVHTLLHPTFTMAVRDGLLRLNPTDGVMTEIKKSHCWEKKKRHALTVPEQRAFTNYIANSEEYRGWYPLFTVMLGTGCRIGEVLGLRWQDVDFKNRTISINHNLVYRVQEDGTCTNHVNSPKTKAGIRIIPMLDEVFDAFLEEYQYQKVIGFCTDEIDGYSGFVFCTGDGKVYLPNAINRTIRSICADYNKEEESKAKEENRDPVLLPKFSCHILRHTFCTRFCENETNLKVIQEIMGHADISTTMDVYAEATQEKKKESMTSLQSALLVR